ncbi:hypothetical protein [Spongiactinospora sp. TRM90649]|uniref:hypothetical protein n=1 Tax=Spongiactinospora sp. TRM90649 TaxID=3031114 RepID=UPI0023F804F3|nr:hypothetical protein [Spongiactinospora sp. TRM90649]MDF5755797.1 hypothetical protein [Spongiactinospora sp. TRM90649]
MAISGWIRPWYPGRISVATAEITGHIYADCEDLLAVVSEPAEGAGWLDPRAPGTCPECLLRHAPDIHADVYGLDEEGDEAA